MPIMACIGCKKSSQSAGAKAVTYLAPPDDTINLTRPDLVRLGLTICTPVMSRTNTSLMGLSQYQFEV